MVPAGPPIPVCSFGGTRSRPPPARRERGRFRRGNCLPAGSTRTVRGPKRNLPETMVVLVTGTDPDGDALARPVTWDSADGPPPVIFMAPEPRGRPALAPGERVLARLKPAGQGRFEGRTLRRLADAPGRVPRRLPARSVAGPFRAHRADGSTRQSGMDCAARRGWRRPRGEIVLAEPLPHHRLGLKPARIIERLGAMGDARSVSLIAIHTHDIPQEFPAAALEEANRATRDPLGQRTDLRDGPTGHHRWRGCARLRRCGATPNPTDRASGSFVAIADVAHYVRPGSALDHAARTRGNSVYFPDRVVPMLPEALSNGWCSLRPNEDRGCLFVELHIGADGRKTVAPLRPRPDAQRGPSHLRAGAAPTRRGRSSPRAPLCRLSAPCSTARTARGTLDLDLPERRVVLDDDGRGDQRRTTSAARQPPADRGVHGAGQRRRGGGTGAPPPALHVPRPCSADPRKSSHRCATSCMGSAFPLTPGTRSIHAISTVCCGESPARRKRHWSTSVMLRCQSQAEYSPDNIGHFGLALPRYAHFTSPIRRYADLLVHRALIRGLRLGRWRTRRRRGAALPRNRVAHHRDRTTCPARRTRSHGPLPGCIHGRQNWREFRSANFRCDAVWAFRHSRRKRCQWHRPVALAAGRLLAAR